MWTYNVAELRQTFRCPHCKNHITTVRPKGQRIAQASWRFCPFCGKPVDMEDEDSDERASDNVLIEPGARVKIEVTSEPEDKEYHGTYAVDPSGNLRFRLMPVSATSARVTTVKQSVRENFPHQLILSFNVTGFTTDKLEKELETRLRTWFKDPRVSAAVISRK